MENEPIRSVQVLVFLDRKILVGFHIDKNVYGIPGGHLEDNETLEEAAIREVEEESGVKCTNLKFIHNFEHVNQQKNRTYIVSSFTADYSSGEFEDETGKTSKWKWMKIEEALELPFYETGRKLIEEVTK